MISYFEKEEDAVGFANDLNQTFGPGSASITTIIREKSEVFAVTIATGMSSDAIGLEQVAKDFFSTQVNT